MQHALIQQVLEALEAKILTRLRNHVTGQIPEDTRTLTLHLFWVYGKYQYQEITNQVRQSIQYDLQPDQADHGHFRDD